MNVGMEWVVDAAGCDPELLRSPTVVRSLCARILEDLDLQTVGQGHVHHFPSPGGVTALYLLTESHLACHTYPEHGIATFNLHCCRMRAEWPWREMLREHLGAEDVRVRRLERGWASSRAVESSLSPTSDACSWDQIECGGVGWREGETVAPSPQPSPPQSGRPCSSNAQGGGEGAVAAARVVQEAVS